MNRPRGCLSWLLDSQTNSGMLRAGGDDQEMIRKGQVQNIKGQVQNIKGQVQNIKGQVQNIKGQVRNIKGQVRNIGGRDISAQAEFIAGLVQVAA